MNEYFIRFGTSINSIHKKVKHLELNNVFVLYN